MFAAISADGGDSSEFVSLSLRREDSALDDDDDDDGPYKNILRFC